MDHCKNCKHWIEPKGKQHGAIWGDCSELRNNDLIEFNCVSLEMGYGEKVELDVHPDFGCVLFNRRK